PRSVARKTGSGTFSQSAQVRHWRLSSTSVSPMSKTTACTATFPLGDSEAVRAALREEALLHRGERWTRRTSRQQARTRWLEHLAHIRLDVEHQSQETRLHLIPILIAPL